MNKNLTKTFGLLCVTAVLLGTACSGGDSADGVPSLAEFDLNGDGQIDDEFIDPDGDGEPNVPEGRLAEYLALANSTDVDEVDTESSGGVKNALGAGLTPNKTVYCDPNQWSNTKGKDWLNLIKGRTFTVTQGDKFVISVKPTGGTYAGICTSAMNFVGYKVLTCKCEFGDAAGITSEIQNNEVTATRSWYTGTAELFTEYYVVFDFGGVAVGKYGMKMGGGAVVAQNFSWGSTNWKGGKSYGGTIEFFFDVQPGPDHLGVDQEPGMANVGQPLLMDSPVVSLRDQVDAIFVKDGQTISVAMDSASGDGKGSVGGLTSGDTVGGVATFEGLIVNGTVGETYTLIFRSGALTETSVDITIATPGPPTKLAVASSTAVVAPGLALNATPVVNATDDGYNLRDDWVGDISVAISGGDGAGSLSGTTTVTSSLGVSEFTDLVIDGTLGETYTLTYTADGLEDAIEEITFDAIDLEVAASVASFEVGTTSAASFSTIGTLLPGDVAESVTYTYEGTGATVYGPDSVAPTEIGTYSIVPSDLTFSSGSSAPYAITYTPAEFEITPAVVFVTSDDLAVRVGDSYAVTNSLSRQLLAGDAIDSVAVVFAGEGDTVYAQSADAPVNVGTYSITPVSVTLSSGDAANYDFRFASGALSIGTVPLEVIADSVSVRAGESVELSYSLNPELLEGDTAESVVLTYEGTGDTEYEASTEVPSAAGTYSVTPSELSLSAGSVDDYEITYSAGTLAIGVIDIAIVGQSATIEVGDESSLSFDLEGTLIDGDVIDGVTLTYAGTGDTEYGPSTTAPTTVGTYSVTPSALVFETGSLDDYAVTYTAGEFVISATQLTVTAAELSGNEGGTITPTFSVSGLRAGDGAASVTFTYEGVDGTDYEASTSIPTAAGTYSVTPSALVMSTGDVATYSVAYEASTLTIAEADEEAPEVAADADAPEAPEAPAAIVVRAGAARYVNDAAEVEVPLSVDGAKASATHEGLSVDVVADGDSDGDDLIEFSSSVQVSGSGFEPGATVDIWMYSTPTFLGSAIVAEDGSFAATLNVPSTIEAGGHSVRVQVGDEALLVPLEKAAYALPATGTHTQAWLLMASVLLGLGLILVSRSRLL